MISFGLTEDQQLLQDTVRAFATAEIRPRMRALEKARAIPADLRKRFFELGLVLLDVPEAFGGQGQGAVSAVVVHEELAFGDPGAAVALWSPHNAAAALLELGSDEQRKRLLPQFLEAPDRLGAVAYSEKGKLPEAGFATRAERAGDDYLLRGAKSFVVHGGQAHLTVVFAQVDPSAGWDGVGAFVVEPPADGLKARARHELLGLEVVAAAEIELEGVRVPARNRLAGGSDFGRAARRFFGRAGLVNAARQVGLARASYEFALAYTQDRRAFGKPVAHFQSIAFTLADMHMDVESARWLVWKAAAELDADAPTALASIAKAGVHANEAAWRVADHGVQLLGGAGFIQDFPAEKWMRDTKALALFAPTDELAALFLAGEVLRRPADFGPGLPTSDVQPIFT